LLSPQGGGKEVGVELEAGRHVGKNKVKDGSLVPNRMSPANVIKLPCCWTVSLLVVLFYF